MSFDIELKKTYLLAACKLSSEVRKYFFLEKTWRTLKYSMNSKIFG